MKNSFSLKHYKYLAVLLLCLSFYSCEEFLEEILIVEDISLQNVNLLAPVDGSELEFTSINFNWSPIEYATAYSIQIATPNFQNTEQIITDVIIDSLTQITVDLNVREYQWRVKAFNSDYETPYTTASFEVVGLDDFSQNNVTLISPEDNLITNQVSQVLQWNAIQDATNYTLEIVNSDTEEILLSESILETSYTYEFAEGDFIWQVRAERDEQATLYSSRLITIDATAPNSATLTSPEDLAVLTDQNISFEWSREATEGSTEFDTIAIYEDEALTILVEEMTTSSPYAKTLGIGTYYWLVQSFDEAGNDSESSEVFSFAIN